MKKIYDFSGEPAYRNYTIKDFFYLKGKKKLSQINVKNSLEAKIAVEANIDLLITGYKVIKEIRKVAKQKFITVAIPFTEFKTNNEILSASLNALEQGADAVYTARSSQVVEYLSNESIPVMAHLGLVPRKSILTGGLRSFGKTPEEAIALLKSFKSMENAGAFAVEAEVIAEKTLKFISQNCKLITISLGSGNYGDVNYLFMEDICGENRNLPRHAFSFAKIYKLQDKIYNEKIKAVKKFSKKAKTNKFAPQPNIVQISHKNFEIFKKNADKLLFKK
jgi:3-methyl-2-oxobutanoate hydroxymethyltransferase